MKNDFLRAFPLFNEEENAEKYPLEFDFLRSLRNHLLKLANENSPKTSFYLGAFVQKYYEFYPDEAIAIAYLKKQGKKNGAKNWKKHNEQTKKLAQRYLQTMKDKGFKSYNQTAEWIFLNDNQENKKYEWILKKLSKADKKLL